MVLLSFDDTDSVRGGCTTHVAFELVKALPGLDLIGFPRLVRLNPNIPFKTRGNGAVALRFGHGRGRRFLAGRIGEENVWAHETGDDVTAPEGERALATARQLIDSHARLDDEKTHPGLVQTPQTLPAEFYEEAVHRLVDPQEAETALRLANATSFGWKSGRGRIGAAAAAAWPARHGTFEWIAYRVPDRWGTPRDLDPALGATLDTNHPSTFDNYDSKHRHLRIAPRSPCPILAGIRGTEPEDVARASHRLGPEGPAGGLLFATNQATDDHVRPLPIRALRPYVSAIVTGRVTRTPLTRRGGHVFLRIADETGQLDLAAFEPTKEFRTHLRRLRPGDVVRAWGGIHEDPTLLSLEKIEVLDALPRVRARAPRCSRCDRAMKSRGRNEGYRCPTCRQRAATPDFVAEAMPPRGAFEVPPLVRRHLTRPLRLGPVSPWRIP